jgi:hypothetical protein
MEVCWAHYSQETWGGQPMKKRKDYTEKMACLQGAAPDFVCSVIIFYFLSENCPPLLACSRMLSASPKPDFQKGDVSDYDWPLMMAY